VGDATVRRRARDALRVRARAQSGTWIEAWSRAAIGRSLLRESEDEQVRLGVVWLLSVPALFERDMPHLAGMCLGEAGATLDSRLMRHDDALRVVRELARKFPGHDALGWGPVRALLGAEPTSQSRPNP